MIVVMAGPSEQSGELQPDSVILTRALQRDFDMGGEVVHAVSGIDVTIRRNEFVAIMGP